MRLLTVTSIASLAAVVLMALACTAAPAELTTDIEATVEARLAQEKTIEATVEARLKTALTTQSLITAIDTEDAESVKEILDSGINPNKNPVPEGFPLVGAYPLHLAVVKGNKEIVQMLLVYGAQIEGKAKNKDEATPLHWAAFFGRKDMISLLINAGAPMNVLDSNHATPLDAAVYVWRLSQNDREQASHFMGIIEMLKAHGGKPADEL